MFDAVPVPDSKRRGECHEFDSQAIERLLTLTLPIFFFSQLFEYERLVKILLHGVSDSEQEGFVQRIAIYLLNSLACQVDGRQKLFLGDLGAIGVRRSLNAPFIRLFY